MSVIKYSLKELSGDLAIYFNWSINALVPFNGNAADNYLRTNRAAVLNICQKLLRKINFTPTVIYRGLLLKEKTEYIFPHENLEYFCFSESIEVAKHFASIHGFGSNIIDLKTRLGEFGYVIHYIPKIDEILFHHSFFDLLPYEKAFSLLGMNGKKEVEGLRVQKEITILQPKEAFYNIEFQS